MKTEQAVIRYHHIQRAPLCLLVYAFAVTFLILAWVLRNEPVIPWVFLPTGLLVLVLAASFHHLTVSDEGDRLSIQFGPLPLFRRSVRYEQVESVEVGRTTLLDGWGIHLSLRGGWVWNLWGRDCIVLRVRKGTLRVGTDDAESLARFLAKRIEQTKWQSNPAEKSDMTDDDEKPNENNENSNEEDNFNDGNKDSDFASKYSDDSFWAKVGKFALVAGKQVIEKALTLYACMKDKDTPKWAKAVIVTALGYFIMPMDAIPDMTPVAGYSDDLGALAAALAMVAAHVKPEHVKWAKEKMRQWFGTKGES